MQKQQPLFEILAQTLTTVQVTGGEVIDPAREAVYFINHVDFQFITNVVTLRNWQHLRT